MKSLQLNVNNVINDPVKFVHGSKKVVFILVFFETIHVSDYSEFWYLVEHCCLVNFNRQFKKKWKMS